MLLCVIFVQFSLAQVETISISGDVKELKAGALNDKLVYAYVNGVFGQLKFGQKVTAGFIEEVIATGIGSDSTIALSTSSGVPLIAIINSATNTLSLYSKVSGFWAVIFSSLNAFGKPGLFASSGETMLTYSNTIGRDLLMSRSTGGNWSTSTVDAIPNSAGRESTAAVSSSGTVTLAYSDETNFRIKVATSINRVDWSITPLSYPGTMFGTAPSLSWLPTGELSVLAGDVMQNLNVGGQGVYHFQRSLAGNWDAEKIAFPAEPSMVGAFIGMDSLRSSAFLIRSGGISSLVRAKREANGLWSGVVAYAGSAGENLISVSPVVKSTGEVNFFLASQRSNSSSILRVSGTEVVPPAPTPTVTPTSIPTAAPTPTPTPTSIPTPVPTLSPTALPTSIPTVAPTLRPTAAPTIPPTAAPTATPIPAPTASPTQVPTPFPTVIPTALPTPIPRSGIDTDGDGLTDVEETDLGSNPQAQDTDGDGVLDGQEKLDQTGLTDASSFEGSTLNRSCTFWEKKKGIQQGIMVKSALPVSYSYSLSLTTFAGALRANDERTIAAEEEQIYPIDSLINSSNLKSGQLCVSYWGRQRFLTAKYYEGKSKLVRSSKKPIKESYLLVHPLLPGVSGRQQIDYRPIKTVRDNRVEAAFFIQNTSAAPVSGIIQSIDQKGRSIFKLSIRLKAGTVYEISADRLKLKKKGTLIWDPSETQNTLRAVFEQQLEKKVSRNYEVLKIVRSEAM